MGVKVAITGGCGFLAAHLIPRLMANPTVEEIRTIDRKPFKQHTFVATAQCSLSSNRVHTIIHFQCDLLDGPELERALAGVDIVFHLARKAFEYLFVADQKALNEAYTRDNLEATQSLLNAIFNCSVPRMVHVGDAFANIPPGDNFGSSEYIHRGLPSKYLLGHYGETRAKAELMGREKNGKILPNGRQFRALFLRPTFVYGEGEKRLPEALKKVAERNGEINEFAGPSNGMLQYIYAGNLASIMLESMELLLSEKAANVSGAFFYCMDDTVCTKFGEFCAPFIHALGHRIGPPVSSQLVTLFKQFIEEQVRWLCGWEVTEGGVLSTTALRFLFSWGIGFSDRTMALILKHRSDRNGMTEWTKQTTDWISREMTEDNKVSGEAEKAAEEQQQRKREQTTGGRGGEQREETMRRMG